MAQKDQAGASESVLDQGAETQAEAAARTNARRADAEAAFAQAGTEGMRSAAATSERIGTGLADGVTNVAGGVIGIVRDTANTAIDGVGSVGGNAVHTLTDLLVGVVGGVRQVAGAAVGGVKSTAQEAFRPQQGAASEEQAYGQEVSRKEQAPRREAPEHVVH
ncbi:MAG TPA: hypothetical protein VM571_00245 [Noviherbaspirillum sp.]|nr:hypothetical protein [Noviherbaspirillum sp.]